MQSRKPSSLPELFTTFDFGSYSLTHSPVPKSRNKHASDPYKSTSLAACNAIPISCFPEQENDQCENHGNTRNSEPESPAKVFLYVAHKKHCYESTCADAEVPPVEEGAFGFAFCWILTVKLVRAKSLRAWLVSTLRNRHEIEGKEEQYHLENMRRTRGHGVVGLANIGTARRRQDSR